MKAGRPERVATCVIGRISQARLEGRPNIAERRPESWSFAGARAFDIAAVGVGQR